MARRANIVLATREEKVLEGWKFIQMLYSFLGSSWKNYESWWQEITKTKITSTFIFGSLLTHLCLILHPSVHGEKRSMYVCANYSAIS